MGFNLWLGFVVAQKDLACEYINFKYKEFCLDSDNSSSDSYSDGDSDGESYSGWMGFNLG